MMDLASTLITSGGLLIPLEACRLVPEIGTMLLVYTLMFFGLGAGTALVALTAAEIIWRVRFDESILRDN